MKFKTIAPISRYLIAVAACGGFAATGALAQTIVPSQAVHTPGPVDVVFTTTAGKNYRIEHSHDLTNWTFYPDAVYGLNQTVRHHVYDASIPLPGPPLPPSTDPRPSEFLFFQVTGFNDGSAVASWRGNDGSAQKAYLPSFNLVYLTKVMTEDVSGTRVPASPALPYRLDVWAWGYSARDPAVVNMQASPAEAATLAKLTSQNQWVYNEMKARVDYRAANPGPPPSPPKLFDDRGQPLRQYFRVREYTIDSNFDGIADHLQLGAGGNAYNMDVDADGIPNGYDRDLWPQAQYPALYTLLSNVMINEVLTSNDFTNADEDGQSQDWVELYNPTNAAVNVGGWYLSDSNGNRTRWQIPAGVTIGSGQFLVIWASMQNRVNAANPLHTNYNISSAPEPIFLSRTVSGNVVLVDSFVTGSTPNYTAQRPDVSFGRFPTASGLQTGHMILPTPGTLLAAGKFSGAHNVVGALGFTDPPVFSGSAPGIYEGTVLSAVLTPPPTGGAVHFTTNSANPTRYSELYSGPISANRSTIVRAIAAKDGWLPSSSVTRSFLFKESILGTAAQGTPPTDQQGAKDAQNQFQGILFGYPESTEDESYPLLYRMDASAVAANKDTLRTELSALPIISIVSTVPEFFEVATGGLYPNSGQTEGPPSSDPRGREWERFCSFEIIEPGNAVSKQANAAILMTGGSSIQQSTTRKHNMRIKFDATYGPNSLVHPLFPGTGIPEFFNFNLKNTTHDSWSTNWGSYITDPATYCNEAFIMATHKAMGHEVPNQRWCHVFINGIYWGPYQITERVDDAFMDAHFGNGDYTVIKQFGEAVSGDYGEWTALETLLTGFSAASAAQKPAIYTQITEVVDMDNYIDYLIANSYGQPSDWPGNNFRVAKRRNTVGAKWKFFVWDAEWTLRQGEQQGSPLWSLYGEEPTHIHSALQGYQPYKDAFSVRMNRAFKTIAGDAGSGSLLPASVQSRFQAAMGRFDDLIFSESARWGCMAKTVPYTKSDPGYLPGQTLGDWDRSTSYILNTWLPQRDSVFRSAFQNAGFYTPVP